MFAGGDNHAIFYDVKTDDSCQVSSVVKRSYLQVTKEASPLMPTSREQEIVLDIDNQRYSVKKGLLDSAILASVPVSYYTFP